MWSAPCECMGGPRSVGLRGAERHGVGPTAIAFIFTRA
jgi:hypothetical protein